MTRPDLSLAREFEAAIAWWRAAGVDCDFGDDATAWLADEAPQVAASNPVAAPKTSSKASLADDLGDRPRQATSHPPPPAPVALRRNLLGDSPPGDLAAFRQWWLKAPELGTTRLNPRISPRGAEGAALMVVVPQPEEQDRDTLLEGPQGRLLRNILAAMGLDDGAVYLASALPCHTPMADLPAIGAGGMDAVLIHHIALVAPQRLLVLGAGLAPFLTPVNDEILRKSNQTLVNTLHMVSETLEAMLHMPRLKARFWKRWIQWSA